MKDLEKLAKGLPLGKMLLTDLENIIREIVRQEISLQAQRPQYQRLQSVEDFCEEVGLSRVTLWRAEKEGRIKLHRIGKRVFIDRNNI